MVPEISIIVPIYNMEKYISRCLDSLLGQSFIDIEILAVNDGSTDTTLNILEQYAQADSRLIIMNKSNSGVSSARNEGILRAKGKYIGFVDPDDWVDSNMYEVMHNTAEREHADIVMCTYMREFGTHSKGKVFASPEVVVYRQEEVQTNITRRLIGPIKEELAQPDYLDAWGTVWSKLYRSELIKTNDVYFIDLDVIGSNEDSLFNIHVCYHAKSFVFINRPFYHYWRTPTASSITSSYNPLLEHKFIKLYRHMESFITTNELPYPYRLALNNRICMNILGLGLNIISSDHKVSVFKKVKEIKSIISNGRTTLSFKEFELRYCPGVWRLFYLFGKWRFAAGMFLMLKSINWIRFMNTRGVANETSSNLAGSNRNEPGRAGDDAHELLPANGSE
ncbi:glycosyltransferase [Paenibacillus sp. BR2-3]|uniref:glycosyltransferase family 2 protein n=1 Tax=Paenibacillus sp. BR2-3 TaxID=3048494 RepID=UPI003977BD16